MKEQEKHAGILNRIDAWVRRVGRLVDAIRELPMDSPALDIIEAVVTPNDTRQDLWEVDLDMARKILTHEATMEQSDACAKILYPMTVITITPCVPGTGKEHQ